MNAQLHHQDEELKMLPSATLGNLTAEPGVPGEAGKAIMRAASLELNRRASRNLRRIWNEYRRRHDENREVGTPKMSQERFVEEVINRKCQVNWRQATFSGYLNNGYIGPRPLGIFCSVFEVSPGDIREEYRSEEANVAAVSTHLENALQHLACLPSDDQNVQAAISDIRGGLRSLNPGADIA